ncbi:MAG TPA: thioesterase family protein [Parvibaculum sp.]|uniref:thioesterase family protein n=1 Tax=Parvibaculum sp. TaxID=2024848 RepID=UPI002BB48F60|nr:thioesterase family protein [Parvibaculum sp.]HMM15363.1 thioesterase family protein [Parvibaculum sp.]
MESVFKVDGAIAHARTHAAGPWDPSMQHGGAPSSLLAWAIERIPTAVPMQVARLTFDLLRPVPLGDLEVRTEVVREGRKIQLCAASLLAGGKEVVRASALKIRAGDYAELSGLTDQPVSVPGPLQSPPIDEAVRMSSGFISGLDVRNARGSFGLLGAGGPAACWFRLNRPIVEGEGNSALMRAAAVSDFCNGVSSVLDRSWTFLNGDLSINLARMPVGEWILLDAEAWLGTDGVGIAAGRLADEQGYFGRAVQSLVIEKR